MSLVKWMNSTVGRLVRVIAGLVLVGVGFAAGGTGGLVVGVLGLVPLLAGAFGVCLFAPLMRVPPRAH